MTVARTRGSGCSLPPLHFCHQIYPGRADLLPSLHGMLLSPPFRHPMNSDLWGECRKIMVTQYFPLIFPCQRRWQEHLWCIFHWLRFNMKTYKVRAWELVQTPVRSQIQMRRRERRTDFESSQKERRGSAVSWKCLVSSLTMWSVALSSD